jgi:hypothetical protein
MSFFAMYDTTKTRRVSGRTTRIERILICERLYSAFVTHYVQFHSVAQSHKRVSLCKHPMKNPEYKRTQNQW